jgi:hypothetical protein
MSAIDEEMLANLAKAMGPSPEPMDQPKTRSTGKTKPGEKFDIYKVDYPWVDE